MDIMEKHRKKHETRAKSTKELVFDALKQSQVREVIVDFDGAGDSGQINDVLYKKGVGKKEGVSDDTLDNLDIEGAEVVHSTKWDKDKDKWVEVMKPATLRDLIEQLCYDLLEANHGGWEINEGSFGEFHLIVKDNTIELTYNQRVESIETEEETY
jgi:hypothetical protein